MNMRCMELIIPQITNLHCHRPQLLLAGCTKWKASTSPAAKGNPTAMQNNAMRYLLPNFEATTLQGMLCILLLACLFGILPASHIWGERGLVPTQNGCAGHTRSNIFTEELYRHLSLVENGTFTVSFPDYILLDSCVQKPQAICAPDWTKGEIPQQLQCQ